MLSKKDLTDIANKIRNVPNFPKEGINFKDITPVLSDIEIFRKAVKQMATPFMNSNIHIVVGIESRGFIFGVPIADCLNCGFVPVRKPGKLPCDTESVSYKLEYGKDSLEIHKDAIEEGQNILIVDDLLATGGTAEATCKLISKSKGNIVGFTVMIELEFLLGREKLNQYNVHSLVKY